VCVCVCVCLVWRTHEQAQQNLSHGYRRHVPCVANAAIASTNASLMLPWLCLPSTVPRAYARPAPRHPQKPAACAPSSGVVDHFGKGLRWNSFPLALEFTTRVFRYSTFRLHFVVGFRQKFWKHPEHPQRGARPSAQCAGGAQAAYSPRPRCS